MKRRMDQILELFQELLEADGHDADNIELAVETARPFFGDDVHYLPQNLGRVMEALGDIEAVSQ
ncbi:MULTISPECIES: hypothetical protein [Pseudomonas]|uniref:hypothetical protein n=1 Tax=Pseudomonas TaxID=286 RepID=UPI0020970509|nr:MULTISPECIES: hypothetical protein [Pseudomonas]MCO7578083.1 hypothetical protein [Pseudomonas protegens]MCO7580724.1 hypothetical protein [Pseudomonas chlororaphis]MCO7598251.1 hypothetical protein [Pseudomonas chlororaphis]MDC7813221.1 hypothetical protein [Pseudomonas sp. BLCC-B112]